MFLEHVTAERRKQRRSAKTITADNDNDNDGRGSDANQLWHSDELLEMTGGTDYEHMQLDIFESFFLVYGLNTLKIFSNGKPLSIDECWTLFTRKLNSNSGRCQNVFAIQYAVYHHFRSLGWAPKRGTKFGVDFGK